MMPNNYFINMGIRASDLVQIILPAASIFNLSISWIVFESMKNGSKSASGNGKNFCNMYLLFPRFYKANYSFSDFDVKLLGLFDSRLPKLSFLVLHGVAQG